MMFSDLELAKLCQAAYDQPDSLTVSEVDVHMRSQGARTVLAVRGTEIGLWPFCFSWKGILNWRDVFRNLRFIPINVGYGYVHRGFYLSASRWLWAYRHKLPLTADTGEVQTYTLTGHSKGAAEAVQLAILMHSYGYQIDRVIVFAEPKSLFKTSHKALTLLGVHVRSYLNRYDFIRFTPLWGRPAAKRIKLKGTPRGHRLKGYINALGRLS